jgi:hypothetical protein
MDNHCGAENKAAWLQDWEYVCSKGWSAVAVRGYKRMGRRSRLNGDTSFPTAASNAANYLTKNLT